MKKVYSAKNESELVVLRSVLDAEGIPCFVHNEMFGSIVVGPKIDNYNAKSIMVPDELEARARDIVAQFETEHPAEDSAPITLRDRLRMILETGLFSWFIPGRSRRKTEGD
ncbi:MAG: DUF2007 domain-containing protein [Candidatus Krumholzibacteria bacterium]|nr:DUF2007 domain-containing protein [Candidatus Krumholzibacteria bacterium]MDH4338370.1 DUF2007 domain-containing protein [Candidatus Krumholzibacteria bacterium]MDH5271396.1 DUF2007 domain-containing protein [Candidatus Krumholzibacteria bacterium]